VTYRPFVEAETRGQRACGDTSGKRVAPFRAVEMRTGAIWDDPEPIVVGL